MSRTTPFESLQRDLKHGVRTMLQNPGFSAAVVLTIALGIGANTAMFSVIRAVLLKPLAFRDPDRVVQRTPWRRSGSDRASLSGF